MSTIARRLIVTGRVQGVFYRNWTVDTARGLALSGWVRNLSNGDVEAVLEGTEAAVQRFITLAHQGPPAAKVDGIAIAPVPVEGFAGFEKRPTH